MCNFKGAVYLISLLFLLVANASMAATFTVTVATDCGTGTIVEAIAAANTSPGHDTINFASGIEKITFPNCRGMTVLKSDSEDFYYLWIKESVDIGTLLII